MFQRTGYNWSFGVFSLIYKDDFNELRHVKVTVEHVMVTFMKH